MTALKFKDAGGWVPLGVAGPQGPEGPQGPVGPAGPRVEYASIWHSGDYLTGSWPFTTPFKCDLGVFLTMSFWANAAGFTGYIPRIDGVTQGSYCDGYFNLTGTHMTICTAFVYRNCAAGDHAVSFALAAGAPGSDGNDRAHWAFTMVEVP